MTMARPSLRDQVLDAAVELLDREGGADITLDAVAKIAGLTKGGVMYHFPTKEDLVIAVIRHVAERWEGEMLEVLGVPFETATPHQRIRAYAIVAGSQRPTRSDFATWSDAAYRAGDRNPWVETFSPWLALPDTLPEAERSRLHLARLAADGLWCADATGVFRPQNPDRSLVYAHILQLTESAV
jgi:AcrR family transcriptional regulator